MARGVDFQQLYHEFGLRQDASFDELRLAYRRRVSVLHPDRHDAADPISQDLANQHLQRLTALYEAAMQFHRQHGRLPGALLGTRVAAPTRAARPIQPNDAATPAESITPSRRWWALIVLPAVLGVTLWLVFALDQTDHARNGEPIAPSAGTAPAALPSGDRASPGDGIHLGMAAREVERVLGEPVLREAGRWDYGPSWVSFQDGKVDAWYSSPLRSLRIAKAAPATPGQQPARRLSD